MLNIISWLLLGLISGAVAKWIMPGPDPGGAIVTILLGIAGAMLGGVLGNLVGLGSIGGLSISSVVTAVAGALILLYGYRRVKA
ncbi:GlsB/YeaQ/YmgE family stress response membrane protein [Chitinophagales bacterium]|nr:GlsB/YeaQ/YmgE family stress response membrane protein [Chitinophagales bacterium]